MTQNTKPIDLFQPITLANLPLNNRFVRSATCEGMAADDGTVTDKLIQTLTRLTKGGVGLVITGHSYVLKQGQAGPWRVGLHDPAMKPGLSRLTDSVHEAGGAIAAQLAHGGILTKPEYSGGDATGPSDGEGFRAMTLAEIETTVHGFASAAKLCRESGFDAVQVHGAHGYLLSQFLSPYFNHRIDAYGGNLENRARFLLEVVRAVRAAVGPDYPVLCKLNSEDFLPDGLAVVDSLLVGKMLEEAGVDILELSGGTGASGKFRPVRPGKVNSPEEDGYFKESAKRFRAEVNLPLILVGGIRSLEGAQRMVENGLCDAVSMSRPLIREPELVNRWKSGDLRPAACVSDNLCFKPARSGEGIYCLTEKLEKEKQGYEG